MRRRKGNPPPPPQHPVMRSLLPTPGNDKGLDGFLLHVGGAHMYVVANACVAATASTHADFGGGGTDDAGTTNFKRPHRRGYRHKQFDDRRILGRALLLADANTALHKHTRCVCVYFVCVRGSYDSIDINCDNKASY